MSSKKKNSSDYNFIYNLLADEVGKIQQVEDSEELEETFKDSFLTAEQKKRDEKITELLGLYVDNYSNKTRDNVDYRKKLFRFCLIALYLFSALFSGCIILAIWRRSLAIKDVVSLISVCITFLSLIVGLLKIITTYAFPASEEEYITKIVETIQKNDLDNKKENMKVERNGRVRQVLMDRNIEDEKN